MHFTTIAWVNAVSTKIQIRDLLALYAGGNQWEILQAPAFV